MIMWMKSDRELKNTFSSIQAFECLILQKLFLRSGTEKIQQGPSEKKWSIISYWALKLDRKLSFVTDKS